MADQKSEQRQEGHTMRQPAANDHGFTLIELMVYTGIFGIVLGAIFSAYYGQLRSQVIQRDVAEMQQNLRAAIYLMDREIKLAGLNPAGTPGIGMLTADAHELRFSMDFRGGASDGIDNDDNSLIDEGENDLDDNGNGLKDEPDEAEWYDGDTDDPGEDVTYRLSNDADDNGRNDGGICHLLRNGDVMALNIEALNFVYLDENGVPLATPVAAADLGLIRSIQVALVARSGERVSTFARGHVDSRIYRNQRDDVILPAQNDAFRRLALSTEVKCRNLGL
ncbi:MAG: prepilin-type N-terminal cleavage/methylation domain-containing protein [Desulfobacteraceae bacterium]|nr:MAG: prepilin-type N-terminal cleavage/methylation domain-containing protein [Desulfobacteraceae bacterium]